MTTSIYGLCVRLLRVDVLHSSLLPAALRKTIEAMIQTAPDIEAQPDKFAIEMMLTSMSGAMRSLLEAGGSAALMRKL
jgi:hypothetical protein